MSGSVGSAWPIAERAGFIASIASVGATFEPGLLPRPPADQALVTAVVGAVNYGIVTTCQTALLGTVRALMEPGVEVSVGYLAESAGFGAGLLTWAAGTGGRDRPVARAVGLRIMRSCAVGLAATAAAHLDGHPQRRLPGRAAPGGRQMATLLGAATAAVAVYRRQRRTTSAGPAADPPGGLPETLRCVLFGGGLSVVLTGLGRAEHAAARRVAATVDARWPRAQAGADAAVLGYRAVLLWATLTAAVRYVQRRAAASQTASSRIDPQLADGPAWRTVSGGPASGVPYTTLGREGARFVHAAATGEQIAATTGASRVLPVRAYVGLASAGTVSDRVDLAVRELDALGGFDRSVLCVAVPAGTGFVNPVAVGALEHLTQGDCATVAVQYSLRQSFYSLNRVRLGAEQNRALLGAITDRLRLRPANRRPTVLLYGESLGALTAQATLSGDGVAALDDAGVDLALFAGTPSRSAWARRWRAQPDVVDPGARIVEIGSRHDWPALTPDRRDTTRVVLLSHRDDPVIIFDRWLILRPARVRPAVGAAGTQPTGFRPLTTFALTAIDLKNAMRVDPAALTTTGHDYRGELTHVVSYAFRLPVDPATLDRIDMHLRPRTT